MNNKFKVLTTSLMIVTTTLIAKAETNDGMQQNRGERGLQKQEARQELKKEIEEKKSEMKLMNQSAKEEKDKEKSESKANKELNKEMKEEKKEEKKAASCTNIQTRVQNRITVLQNSYNSSSQVISNIEASIQKKIDSLKKSGKDATKLESNFASYKTKATDFLAQKQVMINQLKELQKVDCTTDPKGFLAKLKTFNGSEKTHSNSMKVLKDYLKQNVLSEVTILVGNKEVNNNVQ